LSWMQRSRKRSSERASSWDIKQCWQFLNCYKAQEQAEQQAGLLQQGVLSAS
jgi:hypothetical protein